MRTIILFIIRQHHVLLFLLLTTLSTILTINNNLYQHAVAVNLLSDVTGVLHTINGSIRSYLLTVENNKWLQKENKILYEKVLNHEALDNVNNNNYNVIPANVIYATVNQQNNYIIINKGKKDSVLPDMGVICPQGVVGIVKSCSNHFATVLPIININAHVSVRILNNQYFGTTTWKAKNYQYVNISDIPYHVKLHKGDTVYTSGFSQIFPQGIIVGTIEKYDYSEGTDFYNIEVNLSTDFQKLNQVYVIKNNLKPEFDSLLKSILNAE